LSYESSTSFNWPHVVGVCEGRMFCTAVPPKPRVLTINLNDSNIAQEAELLRLTHQSQEIEVRLK
jgi:hypothetical protein